MSDVFISYSSLDIDFVRYLFDQLTARDRQPWADWQDIPPTADWLAEIYRGIEAADSFLFIISPDSVAFVCPFNRLPCWLLSQITASLTNYFRSR
jgi:hypothetical protein